MSDKTESPASLTSCSTCGATDRSKESVCSNAFHGPVSPTFSNELSNAEAERLALLMEECSEVVQACAKILRHGYASANPTRQEPNPTNRECLEAEIGHVLHAVDRLCLEHDVEVLGVRLSRDLKAESVWKWLHHQGGAK